MLANVYKFEQTDDYINQLILFNCNKINVNPNEVTIEYSIENPDYNKTKFTKSNLLLSSITFLNDTPNVYLLITDITFDKYKYKKYVNNENNKIFVSESEKNKHIIYDSTKAIIFVNREQSKVEPVLFINIYNSPPKLEYNHSTERNINITEIKRENITINNYFNFDFYEKLLYQRNADCLNYIWPIFDKMTSYTNIEFTDMFDINVETTKKLKNKYGDVIQDILEINKLNFKVNRFFQRFTFKNFMSKEVCNWFVEETEKYVADHGWNTKNFENYITTDIDLIKLKNIQEYFLKYELKKIMKLIEQSYCLPPETSYDITDLNIIKYDNENISGLNKHTDSSFLTFNIALNSANEYEGGGTYFDDGLTCKNDIGDMLIHCGKIDHIGIPIKKGVRYILVGFINIKYVA